MALGAPCGVPQAWLPLRVASTNDARRLVRSHGGTLYVTLGADGGARISTAPPAGPVDTDGVDGGGYLLVYDRRLPWPAALRVSLAGPAEIAVDAVDADGSLVWRAGTDPAPVV